MNAREFEELRAHVQAYAQQHGVEAELWREDMPGSDVQPAGPRICMQVLRRIEGQPAREHPAKAGGYRPEVQDLRARLERDIREAAQALYAPTP